MKIKVNNTILAYEKQGSGKPLLLLHGNGENRAIFYPLADRLSNHFTVYLIDSRNHGESERTDDFSYAAMAEDILCFLRELRIEKPAALGFSDGGILALLIAARHPELFSRLIVCGANTNPGGIKCRYRLLYRLIHFFTRSPYLKMMFHEPNLTGLDRIAAPTLITAGERDVIRESHTRQLHNAIPGSRLKLFRGETHGSYLVRTDQMYDTILEFLDGENSGLSL